MALAPTDSVTSPCRVVLSSTVSNALVSRSRGLYQGRDRLTDSERPATGATMPPTLAGMSSPHLIKPIPTYAHTSPQLAQSILAYPSPPLSTQAFSLLGGHAQPSGAGLTERMMSPAPPATTHPYGSPAAGNSGLTASPTRYGTMSENGHASPLGGQEVVAEADPSANLAELEGKLSVGIDFGCAGDFQVRFTIMSAMLTDLRTRHRDPARPFPASRTARIGTWEAQSGRSSTGREPTRHIARCQLLLCITKRLRRRRRSLLLGESRQKR